MGGTLSVILSRGKKLFKKVLYTAQSVGGPGSEISQNFNRGATQFKYCMVQIQASASHGVPASHTRGTSPVDESAWSARPLYLAPGLVVVEIHGRPRILPGLQGVDKLFGNGLPEANIVTAAAPEPAVTTWENVKGCKKKKR